jgi:hypothetical protein
MQKVNTESENKKSIFSNQNSQKSLEETVDDIKKKIDMRQVNYIIEKLEKFKEEGSTTKWFSKEFMLNLQTAEMKLN